MADAYNLMVSAWHAQYAPKLAGEAQQMVKAIAASITEWDETSADLAVLAAQLAHFCDQAMPEEVDGKKYERPTEKIRLLIEKRNLVPA